MCAAGFAGTWEPHITVDCPASAVAWSRVEAVAASLLGVHSAFDLEDAWASFVRHEELWQQLLGGASWAGFSLSARTAHTATAAAIAGKQATTAARSKFGGEEGTPVIYRPETVSRAAAGHAAARRAEPHEQGAELPRVTPAVAPRVPVVRAADGTTLLPMKLFELWDAWCASHETHDPTAFGTAVSALVARETARALAPGANGKPCSRDFWAMNGRIYLP
jgi:hypothetical protein